MKNSINNTIGILLLLFVISLFGCKEDEITNISADTLIIDQTEVILEPGDSIKLTATVMPDNAGNRAVLWKTSSARIASVTGEGWLKAERPGQATITAIAYSNTEIRNSISVTVDGIPDDVVSGVVGTYTGDLVIPALGFSAANTELTLTQDQGDFYSVRLITEVDLSGVPGVDAVVPINMLTGVDRVGDKYKIEGEKDMSPSPLGKVTVKGTVDSDGNIEVEITVGGFDNATATYVGKNVVNMEEIVTGTYMGDVVAGAPVGSNVTVIITREENKYKLKIDDIIAGYPFQTEIEIIVSQSGNNLAISSEPGTATVGPITTQVTITSGTITAAGAINFDIEIIGLENLGAPSNTATYSGQKLENLAKAVSGTYEGVVSIGQQPISAPNAEIVLTVVDRTTVKWTTSTQIMLPSEYGGAQTFTIAESDNFTLNVAGGSGTYTLTGEGTTSLGPITISSGSVEGKDISLTMSSGQLPVSIIYEGKKQ